VPYTSSKLQNTQRVSNFGGKNIQIAKSQRKKYLQYKIKNIRDTDCVSPSSALNFFPSCPDSHTFAPNFKTFPKPPIFFHFI
jgi:hypothetical protein